MKIFVDAKPAAKEMRIERLDPTHFVVAVKEPPRQGKANAAIARSLAEYFNVSTSQIRLLSGFSFKSKIFEVSLS